MTHYRVIVYPLYRGVHARQNETLSTGPRRKRGKFKSVGGRALTAGPGSLETGESSFFKYKF